MLHLSKPMIGVVPLVDYQRDSLWMLPGYLTAKTAVTVRRGYKDEDTAHFHYEA